MSNKPSVVLVNGGRLPMPWIDDISPAATLPPAFEGALATKAARTASPPAGGMGHLLLNNDPATTTSYECTK